MPFEPNILVFRWTDIEKVVKFNDAGNALPDWIVNGGKIGAYNISYGRWSFHDVDLVPGDPSRRQGTLRFDASALGTQTGDAWLLRNWPRSGTGSATLELNVGCNLVSRPLTISLIA